MEADEVEQAEDTPWRARREGAEKAREVLRFAQDEDDVDLALNPND